VAPKGRRRRKRSLYYNVVPSFEVDESIDEESPCSANASADPVFRGSGDAAGARRQTAGAPAVENLEYLSKGSLQQFALVEPQRAKADVSLVDANYVNGPDQMESTV